MTKLSTEQVAKLLGLDPATLSRYIKVGKISAPEPTMAGGIRLRLWSESDIETLKEVLPKIANGRKTRYQKLRDKQKAPPKAHSTRSASSLRAGLVPHKQRKPKKK